MSAESFFAEREYQLGHSLRFDHVAAHKLSRTPAAAGNRKTWTWSAWVKRGFLSTQHNPRQVMMGVNNVANDTQTLEIGWHSDDKFYITTQSAVVQTSQLFRDPSAWYHIVVVANTTLAGDTDRFKLYVNGVDQSLGELTSVSQNEDTAFNQAALHTIGDGSAGRDLDGYLSEVHFLDGYAYGPEYFGTTGEFDEEWLPIQYTGAYGTNGFYLTFAGGGVMSASGGNSTATDGDFKAASFTSNGTFTPSVDGFVEYLVIAGGGAGAADGSTTNGNGGGGAGGFRTGMLPVAGGTGYSITVGAGGVGALSANAVTGGNSVFSTITSAGGGGGGYYVNTPGEGGGSGGGGGANSGAGGGASPAGQGFAGEAGSSGQGGGGGGAAETGGADGTGQGGDGLASSITGSSVTRAGGGAGSRASGGARAGGTGGGGAGGNGGVGGDGSTNTGSGGGAGVSGGESGSGGSGIVIIRYKYQ